MKTELIHDDIVRGYERDELGYPTHTNTPARIEPCGNDPLTNMADYYNSTVHV